MVEKYSTLSILYRGAVMVWLRYHNRSAVKIQTSFSFDFVWFDLIGMTLCCGKTMHLAWLLDSIVVSRLK